MYVGGHAEVVWEGEGVMSQVSSCYFQSIKLTKTIYQSFSHMLTCSYPLSSSVPSARCPTGGLHYPGSDQLGPPL